MYKTLQDVKAGKRVELPAYDYVAHKRYIHRLLQFFIFCKAVVGIVGYAGSCSCFRC